MSLVKYHGWWGLSPTGVFWKLISKVNTIITIVTSIAWFDSKVVVDHL
jgi:hypothetical protein